jgi:hypothetical protein
MLDGFIIGNGFCPGADAAERRAAKVAVWRRDAMTADETELEMAVRHVAEQERRIARQEVLIERLRQARVPPDDALGLLATMHDLLEEMRDHVARLSH